MRHLIEALVEGAGAFAQSDRRIRQFIESHGANRGGLVQPNPDIGEHDDDERRQVQKHDQQRIAKTVDRLVAAHGDAEHGPQDHRQRKSDRDAGKRDRQVREQRARPRLGADDRQDGKRRAAARRTPPYANPFAKRPATAPAASAGTERALVFPGRQAGAGFIINFLIKFLCRAGEIRCRPSWRGHDRESARRRLPLRAAAVVCHRYSFAGKGRALPYRQFRSAGAMFSQSASE